MSRDIDRAKKAIDIAELTHIDKTKYQAECEHLSNMENRADHGFSCSYLGSSTVNGRGGVRAAAAQG